MNIFSRAFRKLIHETEKIEIDISPTYQTGDNHWSRRRCKMSGQYVQLLIAPVSNPSSDRHITCPGCNRMVMVLSTNKIVQHLPTLPTPKELLRNG